MWGVRQEVAEGRLTQENRKKNEKGYNDKIGAIEIHAGGAIRDTARGKEDGQVGILRVFK